MNWKSLLGEWQVDSIKKTLMPWRLSLVFKETKIILINNFIRMILIAWTSSFKFLISSIKESNCLKNGLLERKKKSNQDKIFHQNIYNWLIKKSIKKSSQNKSKRGKNWLLIYFKKMKINNRKQKRITKI